MSWLGIPDADLAPALWTVGVAIVCNVSCAVLGCYLVLRRLSMLGDAISHGVLPGIAVAFLLTGRVSGVPIILGAMLVGVLTAFLTQMLHSFGRVPEDASMGVVFTSLFAIGVIMITRAARNVHLDAGCVLYGDIDWVATDTFPLVGYEIPRALPPLLAALALTLVFVGVFWKELKVVSFDPMLATSMGISAGVVHYLLMAMVAGATVAAFESVGSILVIAMLIVPGATAHLLTDRLGWMMVCAAAVGVVSAVGGYLGAYHLNTSTAGMMAVVAGMLFTFAVVFAPRYGIASKMAHNLMLSLRIVGEDILAMLFRAEEVAGGAERCILFRAATTGEETSH